MTSLNFKDYIDYDCKNLDQYGLKDPSAVITLDYTVTHEAESSEPGSEPGTEPGSEPASEPASEPGTEPGSETASAPGTKTTEADDVQTEESESETQSTKLVTEVKQVILQIGNQTEDGDYYVKTSDNNEVHTMSADALKPWLEAQYSDLRKAE